MIDIEIVRFQTHRKNIERYIRLLQTSLTEVERQYIERRLTEERSAMERLQVLLVGEADAADQARNPQPSVNPATTANGGQPEVPSQLPADRDAQGYAWRAKESAQAPAPM
ncbi:hypothetical protein NLM27_23530 [Bradyrhizobium sp. CCGB12]|uniref:hypothetical protein n=1 Tax=Bradyrhizobium sp. CCGB12 TaxID=2949632 RepID=UPI0020B2FC69|nr:hypothetical protein [Bradyrhizobium sp. CCGB12]MCP3391767.1 hypothetical protein [Bradyrhizobium sp. CCGB12]